MPDPSDSSEQPPARGPRGGPAASPDRFEDLVENAAEEADGELAGALAGPELVASPDWAQGVVAQDGNTIVYTDLGPTDGPVVVLVHGMVSDSTTFTRPAQLLAARGFRVIAPDLLGHGRSSKPATGGYLLPDFAASVAGLLDELGTGPVTLVGHSLGAAVVMQLTRDRPDLVRRLVLVAAGGLGKQIHPLFRAASLKVADPLFRLALNERTAPILRRRRLHRSLRLSEDVVTNLGRAGSGLITPTGRAAFFHTLRGVIDRSGQRGSMLELGFLPRALPTLIVWSVADPIVPVSHAYQAHAYLTNSRLLILEGASHQPHHAHAAEFAAAVADFIAET
ncbi:MAG TPA: alpha/beta fold hydrolase [Jatrophihabitans sp.]|nr:alpha/beta fold hydrolase [Jatrophihabitans sp.]